MKLIVGQPVKSQASCFIRREKINECKLVEEGSTDICKHFSPVSVGNIHKVKIVDRYQTGDGIAKIKGFEVIVPNAHVGDTITIETKSIKNGHGFATEIKQKSKNNTAARTAV
jgi:predicted RNA-binding protein with TRAM domain